MCTPCHNRVEAALREEQQGLCCYCEGKVADGEGHIEHLEPRAQNNTRTYDYANLALSCDGGRVEHCGRYKDDRKKNPKYAWDAGRFSSPHDPMTASLFRYLLNGSIAATKVDEDKAGYLIGYLGLDCARLCERRKKHARQLIDTMGDNPDLDLVAWLREEYLQADANSRLKQFHSLSTAILQP